jgi:hypothetical protein
MPTNENVKVYVQMTTQVALNLEDLDISADASREEQQAVLRQYLQRCEGDITFWNQVVAMLAKKVTFSGKIEY